MKSESPGAIEIQFNNRYAKEEINIMKSTFQGLWGLNRDQVGL